MYPSTHLPAPLSPQQFYILLALCRTESHGYTIGARAANDSLGSIKMADGTLYTLLKRMLGAGLIEGAGLQPAGPSRQDRKYYRLTPAGQIRLKEELRRLQHAVKIGEAAGLFLDQLPLDIQKLFI